MIRRSRRRFWDGDATALQALWAAVVQGLRVIAPVLPFLSEHLWQALVRGAHGEPPPPMHLAGWPEPTELDEPLLAEIADLRRVVALGHQAFIAPAACACASRCAAHRRGRAARGLARRRSAEELRVKELEFGHVEATELHVKLHLSVLGPKLGKELGAVRAALAAGEFEQLDDGGFRVLGHASQRTRCSSSARGGGGRWPPARV